MKTTKVWPNPAGISVPDPDTNKDIEPGQKVNLTGFIIRRLRDGDLVESEPEAPKQPSPQSTKTTNKPDTKKTGDEKSGGTK
jgi:Protein of unknown function (DUF2635)